jgi:hypothetical protein
MHKEPALQARDRPYLIAAMGELREELAKPFWR